MREGQWIVFSLFSVLAATVGMYFYVLHTVRSDSVRISINSWIGNTPLMYAYEKGWLAETPFTFVWLVDVSDHVNLYERGFTQGFSGTQFELFALKNDEDKAKPVLLIDRSNGADAIVSNRSLEEIVATKEYVDVYLNRDSVSEMMWKAFVDGHSLRADFALHDSSQKSILAMKTQNTPSVIVSYEPYVTELIQNKGYSLLGSTKNLKNFYVIDALFVEERVIREHEKDFKTMKEAIKKAIDCLHRNPKEYYATVRPYLEGQSYEAFLKSLESIEWLCTAPRENIVAYLNQEGIATDRIMP